jgi:adenosine deaminase
MQDVKIVLGDDNPIQTMSLLSNERKVLVDELGFSERDLHALDRTSVYAAFVENSVRQRFLSLLNDNSY